MNIVELEKKYKELGEQLQCLKEKEASSILVPDCIHITEINNNCSMWIIHAWKELYYDYNMEDWWVDPINSNDRIKCKLIQTKFEDLEPWDIFLWADGDVNEYKTRIYYYGIKIEWDYYQAWSDYNCVQSDIIYRKYYKVKKI